MKILIAYDGSDCANRAIDDLRRAGLPPEAEAVVISVADVLPVPPPSSYEVVESAFSNDASPVYKSARERASSALDEARKLALAGTERLKALFPAWRVCAEACGDSPAWAVIKMAEDSNADLVVVGSHGRTAMGRFFLGSVSHKIVTNAPCTVRIARNPVDQTNSPVRILVGIDGSPGAEAAVRAVCERHWPPGSEARLVAALDPMMITAVEWITEADRDERAWVERVLEASAQKLRAAELVVSSEIKRGDPKRVLVAEAEHWGADSIFVGARGLRLIERFLVGSVSAAVAERVHCSVEVVRPKK
jgi:nucleotide-binding universal stress UspA family protein